jgi:hypothetical protein
VVSFATSGALKTQNSLSADRQKRLKTLIVPAQDYILRQAKDFARVLAYLLGLAKKGELAEAIEFVEQTMEANYGLSENFTKEKLEEAVRNGRVRPEELVFIGDLLHFKADSLSKLGEDAKAWYAHALLTIELGMELTGTFSFEMQAKIDDLKKLS